MYKALTFKELREIWWAGAIAAVILGVRVWTDVGLNGDLETLSVVWYTPTVVPFERGDMMPAVALVSAGLAIVLGLGQTLGESFRGTWRFLRHRPLPFPQVLLVKAAAGLAVLFVSTGVPLGLYVAWAARDGNHVGPFVWDMAVPTLLAWLASSALYLAAFLVGIREARWYGSRLWPLAPAILLMLLIFSEPGLHVGKLTLLADLALVGAILYAARERND